MNRAVRRWIEEQASIIPPGSFQASLETVLVTASGGGACAIGCRVYRRCCPCAVRSRFGYRRWMVIDRTNNKTDLRGG